jgi:FkbH-like protein
MLRIAIIGNYATQFLLKPLKKQFKSKETEFYQAEFNSIDMELIDPNSNLFSFNPDFIIWHESTLGLRDQFYQSQTSSRNEFGIQYINRIHNYLNVIAQLLPKCKVLFPNHSLRFLDSIFGNFSSKVEISWDYQIQKINQLLNEASIEIKNLYLIESTPTQYNYTITDYSMVVNAELHFTPQYLDWITINLKQTIDAFQGSFKKCVILDLDNTLWGGIIGDDGLENIHIGNLGIGKAFTRFQKWLKELKNRGIILAVCSKNEDSIAKSPFLNHPEMILKLDDVAIFTANWNSKADNINNIQKILNIGFDSMVFLDDNPAEREIVRNHIPNITVPELPIDPSDYLPYLISLNLFETVSHSTNDAERTKQYQQEAQRAELSASITNMDDYLQSLDMIAKIEEISEINIERVAQLTQRSNQFNLRTKRYTSTDIKNICNNPNYHTATVELADKFGNYGLISVVIVEINENIGKIDTWIMSCRVLKRNVEHALMNYLIEQLKNKNIYGLDGEYIPTEKNVLVANLLMDLGMNKTADNYYSLFLNDFKKHKHNIKINS